MAVEAREISIQLKAVQHARICAYDVRARKFRGEVGNVLR